MFERCKIPKKHGVRKVEVYGADWCSDTILVKKFLEKHNISYKWIDVDKKDKIGKNGFKYVLLVNKEKLGIAKKKIPVVRIEVDNYYWVFIEPTEKDLSRVFLND